MASLFGRRLGGLRLRRPQLVPRRAGGQLKIGGVETHQRLAAPDRLTWIHEPLNNLAPDPEAEIALGAGPDHAGIADGRGAGVANDDGADKRRLHRLVLVRTAGG